MAWRRARRRRKKTASLKHQLLFGTGLLILLGGIAYGVWYGTHHESFAITDIEIRGGATVSHQKIAHTVWNTMEGDRYLLVSKRFAYLYPQKDIVSQVSMIPRVHDVDIVREGKRLLISFEEYVPYALWCDGLTNTSCVFLTKDGFGFDEAPNLNGGIFVRYINESASTTPNTKAFSVREMEESATFISAVKDRFNFKISHVVYTADGDIFYYLPKGEIIMTTPSESSLEKLETVLSSEEFSHLRSEPFTYIDLRFGNRVFVKED